GDVLHQVAPEQTGGAPRLLHDARRIEIGRRQTCFLGAAVAQASHQLARIDPLDAGDAVFAQIVAERALRPPVARSVPVLLDDEALHEGPARLDVLEVDADVADLRIRHA